MKKYLTLALLACGLTLHAQKAPPFIEVAPYTYTVTTNYETVFRYPKPLYPGGPTSRAISYRVVPVSLELDTFYYDRQTLKVQYVQIVVTPLDTSAWTSLGYEATNALPTNTVVTFRALK